MRYIILLVLLFISLSCVDHHSIEISPETITVDPNEHSIVFSTDHPFWKFEVWERDTDSSEITESFDFSTKMKVISGDWFTLKGKVHSSQIELYIDANEGKDRRLKFWVTRAGGNAQAVVIQSGKD